MNPTISILIPTYNAALCIGNCLESIISQSYKKFEIIIIDGLSTDETVAIIKKYAQDYPTIKWVSEKDAGVYDAMNKAITKAKGEWIYFLGSNDYFIDENVLEKIGAAIDNADSDILYGKVYFEFFNRIMGSKENWCELATENICHQAIFYRKQVFSRLGFFDNRYKAMADWDFNLRCMYSNVAVKFVNVLISFFSAGGISTKGDPLFYREFDKINAWYAFRYAGGIKKFNYFFPLLKQQIILWKKRLMSTRLFV